jgi:hypothetical protein
MLIVVVLPAPFGPKNPNSSPEPICSERLSTAVTLPKRFVRFLVVIINHSKFGAHHLIVNGKVARWQDGKVARWQDGKTAFNHLALLPFCHFPSLQNQSNKRIPLISFNQTSSLFLLIQPPNPLY